LTFLLPWASFVVMREEGSGKAETAFRGQRGRFWHSILDDNGGVKFVFDFYVRVIDLQRFLTLLGELSLGDGVPATEADASFGTSNVSKLLIVDEIGGHGADQEHHDSCWTDMFAALQQFKAREGHCLVPKQHAEDGATLGAWVNNQRQLKKSGELLEVRKVFLGNLGFVLDGHREKWDEMFAGLQQFKAREGHCLVPKRHAEDGATLGVWVNHQRQIKKKGNLPLVRQVPLNNLGFVWDVKQDLWDVKFALLQQFRERKGHCRVPKGHREDGEALGKWVCDQRCLLKKEESDQHKKNRLLELGFW
jgi:hypothetical protein